MTLLGPRGVVFEDVAFRAAPGSLVAVRGEAGSGRTSLLLALAGRMGFSSGRARVSGFVLPRERRGVQRVVALGLVKGVNDFDETTAVGDLIRAAVPGRARPVNSRAGAAALGATELTLGIAPPGPRSERGRARPLGGSHSPCRLRPAGERCGPAGRRARAGRRRRRGSAYRSGDAGSVGSTGLAPYFIPLALWIGAVVTYLLLRPTSGRALGDRTPAWRAALGGTCRRRRWASSR